MTTQEIVDRIRDYVAENFLYMRQGVVIADSDSLLRCGILDSLGIVELITFVQAEFDVAVNDSEITEENFGSLDAIARFVQRKRAAELAA